MAEFRKPSSGSSSKKGDNIVEFSSYPLDNVYSPFDGTVTNLSSSKCGGNIEIKHIFRGQKVYSNFCGVSTIYVSRGDSVSTGQKIGMFGTSPIEYSINDGMNNLNTRNFFGVSDTETTSKKEKEAPKEKPKIKDFGDESNKEIFGKFVKTTGLSAGQQVMADLLGAPLKFMANTPFINRKPKKKTSNNEEFEDSLNEEIIKIKSLMK